MSARAFLLATILTAASVSAHILPARLTARQDVPDSCVRVSELVGSCVPADATEDDLVSSTVANCICSGTTFDDDIVDCLQAASGFLDADIEAALQGFRGYCAAFGNGGGGSGPDPTPTPTSGGGSGGSTDSEYCSYFLEGINQCWTDNNPLPTAAPVAECLCSGTDFDIAVEGCYSDIVNGNPDGASTVAAFAGFCSTWSAIGDSPATVTPTRTPTTPTPDFDTPTPTRTPVDDDTPVVGTTRVIQTSNPTSTSTNSGNNGGSDDDEESGAAGLKYTLVGTTLAALLAGVALLL
ncbi:hypothetical protein ABW19_dt0205716 [Dactylella cylindrospora]|nr:hypothetical protein ABW19_dt0205716 [Dactylella cylindrospora]